MPDVCLQIRDFIQFIAKSLVKDPTLAQLRVGQTAENAWRFRLLLSQPDVARLIGRNGMTISAIRSMIQAALEGSGQRVKFEVLSHEEAEEDGLKTEN